MIPEVERAPRQTVQAIEAKSIIVDSKLPDTDCVVNPYVGCTLGCGYCYASFMGRMVGESVPSWGDYVYAKVNAVEVIDRELTRMSPAKAHRSLLLSSVTDPYQGAEIQHRLTRGVLERLVAHRYPGRIGILTKSNLVVRDIDLLTQLADVEVGMTVTTTDDRISRVLEVRAPTAARRLGALRRLHDSGLPTYAFVGPLLPHFADRPELLANLFEGIAATGVTSVFVEHLNMKKYIRTRLGPVLATEPPEIQEAFARAQDPERRARLQATVAVLIERHGLTLRLGDVLDHATPVPSTIRRRTKDGA